MMSIDVYLQRLERIDQLIRLKATGTPKELAKKLEISERMLYIYLNIMKEMNGPIKYDKSIRGYYYEYEVKLIIKYIKLNITTNN